MKIKKKFDKIVIFLKCNGMQGVFKLENIVATNGTAHCKLKQEGSKIVSQFKYYN